MRRGRPVWQRRMALGLQAGLLAGLLAAGGWLWWRAQLWQPEPARYPTQGVLIGAQDGALDLAALAGAGADFVYLEASRGAAGRDPRFGANLLALSAAGLPHGAVHAYDPCAPADEQAANFVTIVPRDAGLLPPAIALDRLASQCGDPVIEAAVESELTTFINQVENHTGQPAILKLSPAFEARHKLAANLDRHLWLTRNFLQPDYAGRPWTLWTANETRRPSLAAPPLRWVVVQP